MDNVAVVVVEAVAGAVQAYDNSTRMATSLARVLEGSNSSR
jgi:hypothetical protein